jgi:ethanolamine utilization protein EutQ
MKNSKTGLAWLLMTLSATAFAEDSPVAEKPRPIVKFAGVELTSLMQSPAATKKTTEIRTTTSVPMFKSQDQKFSSGLFSSSAGYAEFESYAGDEFCYFVSGEATITSADGSVLKLKAGDAITIPKGWKGRWDTTGYTKYYVSYRSAE